MPDKLENNISTPDLFLTEFKQQIIYRIELNLPRIQTCLKKLNETEVWERPNESSNSIGNLILHLSGNITQYILSGLGGQADNRNRDSEFSRKNGLNKAELETILANTINNSIKIISSLTNEKLTGKYSIQGYDISGIAALVHVTEHLSYHTGQIVYLTKALKNIDTGFYKGLDLNIKNNND